MKKAHIVEDDANEGIEGNAEEVDDGGSHLLGHMLRAHLHHARPEQPNAELKHTERRQLDLPLPADACTGDERTTAHGKVPVPRTILGYRSSIKVRYMLIELHARRSRNVRMRVRYNVCIVQQADHTGKADIESS